MKNRRTVNGALLDVKSAAEFLGGNEDGCAGCWNATWRRVNNLDDILCLNEVELEEFIDELPGITLRQAKVQFEKENR